MLRYFVLGDSDLFYWNRGVFLEGVRLEGYRG